MKVQFPDHATTYYGISGEIYHSNGSPVEMADVDANEALKFKGVTRFVELAVQQPTEHTE